MSSSPPFTLANAEAALHALWTTQESEQRAAAHAWLSALQDSTLGYQLGLALLSDGSCADAHLFGATLLCNKLRGGAHGGLAPELARNLRAQILARVNLLPPGKLRSQTSRAASLLMGAGVDESSGSHHPCLSTIRVDAQFRALSIDAMLEILALVPEGGGRFISEGETLAMQVPHPPHFCRPISAAHFCRPFLPLISAAPFLPPRFSRPFLPPISHLAHSSHISRPSCRTHLTAHLSHTSESPFVTHISQPIGPPHASHPIHRTSLSHTPMCPPPPTPPHI